MSDSEAGKPKPKVNPTKVLISIFGQVGVLGAAYLQFSPSKTEIKETFSGKVMDTSRNAVPRAKVCLFEDQSVPQDVYTDTAEIY